MHSFVQEMRKHCPIKPREDTSNLAYSCVTVLSEFHRGVAIRHGQHIAAEYRAKRGRAACRSVRNDFAPLLVD